MKTFDKFKCKRCEKITYAEEHAGAYKCAICEGRALTYVGSVTFKDEEVDANKDFIVKS